MKSAAAFLNHRLTWIVTPSALLSAILLFRWIWTDTTPARTFGRVWQYYVNWSDFGFHRRGLIGTLLSESGIHQFAHNEYQFAYIFYSALLALCFYLTTKIILSSALLRQNTPLAFCVFLSPATFLHFAYSTGNHDSLLFALLLLAVFYVRHMGVLSLLLVTGILSHEVFIYFLPGIFLLKFWADPSSLLRLILPALIALATIALVLTQGQINIPIDEYNAIMITRIPMAARAAESLPWSGYFEVASGIAANLHMGPNIAALSATRTYIFLPTLYALMIAGIAAWFFRGHIVEKLLLFTAILFPLLTTLVAWDYYRWVSLSACMGLVCIVRLTILGRMAIARQIWIGFMLFSALAPFGPDVLQRPFPIQQTIWGKITATALPSAPSSIR